MSLSKPKGMPKAEWRSLNESQKKKALKKWSIISVTNNNSGTQNNGVGNSSVGLRGRNLRNMSPMHVSSGTRSAPRSQRNLGSRNGLAKLDFVNRESLGTVFGSATYSLSTYEVNPGLKTWMPIGSTVCGNYERYFIRHMKVIFVPTVSGFATQGQTGRVVMGFGLDPLGTGPTTTAAAESVQPSIAFMPYEQRQLDLSLARPNETIKYHMTRVSRPPAGSDLRLYDACVFWFSTEGCSGAGVIGELFVEYEIELYNLRVGAVQSLEPNRTLTIVNWSTQNFAGGVTAMQNPVFRTVNSALVNGLGCTIANNATFGFPIVTLYPGRYAITLTAQALAVAGNTAAAAMLFWTSGTPVTALPARPGVGDTFQMVVASYNNVSAQFQYELVQQLYLEVSTTMEFLPCFDYTGVSGVPTVACMAFIRSV